MEETRLQRGTLPLRSFHLRFGTLQLSFRSSYGQLHLYCVPDPSSRTAIAVVGFLLFSLAPPLLTLADSDGGSY
jgi:hypothetical protein